MTELQKKAIAAIEAQQGQLEEDSMPWVVGEQLKDICRMEPRSAELIAQDLEVKEMSIVYAERKIKAFADRRKKGGSSGVSGRQADRILREFYGLPAAGAPDPAADPNQDGDKVLRLADFFG